MSPSRTIWTFTLIIIAAGLVALYSASYENVRVSQQVFYDQMICAGFGIIVMYLMSRLHYRFFFDVAYPLYALNVLLLLVVLFAGRSALGATRWFNVFGISFQPSELSKIAVILMLSRYYSTRNPKLSFDFRSTFRALNRDLLFPFFLMLLSFGLIFKQPDLGSALLVFGIFVVMVFMSGLEMKPYLLFLGVCAAMVPIGWHFLKDYQRDRLLVFLNPNADPLGAGYTIIQSRIAIGSGGMAGKFSWFWVRWPWWPVISR
jgi:rod shape determining protein RodA